MNINKKQTILSVILIFFLSGCGSGSSSGSGDDGSGTVIKGTIASNSNAKYSMAISDIGDISTILAFPIEKGIIDTNKKKEIQINSDGSFNATVTQDSNWILMMINKNATNIENRFQDFISVSENSEQRLYTFPMTKALSDIDIGALTVIDNQLSSSNTISDIASNFSISQETILESTGLGSLEKMSQNRYISTFSDWNAPELTINLWNQYQSTIETRGVTIENTANNFTPIIFYDVKIDCKVSTAKFNETESSQIIDTNNTNKLEVFLPNGELINTWITDQELIQEGIPYNSTNVYIQNIYKREILAVDENGTNKTNSSGSSYYEESNQSIPSGYFKVLYNDNQETFFDISIGTIIDNSDGSFRTILPSIKLIVNSEDKIVGIDLEWHKYNKISENYEKITNIDTLKNIHNSMEIEARIWGTDGNTLSGAYHSFSVEDSGEIKTTIEEDKAIYYSISKRDENTKTLSENSSVDITLNFSDIKLRYYFKYDVD